MVAAGIEAFQEGGYPGGHLGILGAAVFIAELLQGGDGLPSCGVTGGAGNLCGPGERAGGLLVHIETGEGLTGDVQGRDVVGFFFKDRRAEPGGRGVAVQVTEDGGEADLGEAAIVALQDVLVGREGVLELAAATVGLGELGWGYGVAGLELPGAGESGGGQFEIRAFGGAEGAADFHGLRVGLEVGDPAHPLPALFAYPRPFLSGLQVAESPSGLFEFSLVERDIRLQRNHFGEVHDGAGDLAHLDTVQAPPIEGREVLRV